MLHEEFTACPAPAAWLPNMSIMITMHTDMVCPRCVFRDGTRYPEGVVDQSPGLAAGLPWDSALPVSDQSCKDCGIFDDTIAATPGCVTESLRDFNTDNPSLVVNVVVCLTLRFQWDIAWLRYVFRAMFVVPGTGLFENAITRYGSFIILPSAFCLLPSLRVFNTGTL
jgi:uncharacterized protein YaiE (UPF0345 family)